MNQLEQLAERIIDRVNVNLSEFDFDTSDYVTHTLEHDKMLGFYAFYGITAHHPIYFHFKHSNMAGSYFLGKCYVGRSAIYKSDIRGDELKRKGDTFIDGEKNIPLFNDEMITIKDSLLYKTLVHSNSHNPANPEEFSIKNTISAHYSNIHGSNLQGCFLAPFATVNFMNLHSCIVGAFSFIQAGDLFHRKIDPGTVWMRTPHSEFKYKFDKKIVKKYVGINASHQPMGIIYDFVKQREGMYDELFETMNFEPIKAPSSSAVNRYARVLGRSEIGDNVLISQRAFLDNARMGEGSNAQENSFIINSNLAGLNVTAHGGKIVNTDLDRKTFIGFNSFLNGKPDALIKIGEDCIVMPHTIIDPTEDITIPSEHLIWGFISSQNDIENQTISFDDFAEIRDRQRIGKMTFNGNGSVFIDAYKKRIDKFLLLNGSLFKEGKNRGHAQDDQNISFNIIQPYGTGERKGLFPSIRINP